MKRERSKLPLFLRNTEAAVAWLKSKPHIMEVFEDAFPPEYPFGTEQYRASTIEDALYETAGDYLERAHAIIAAGYVTLYRAIRIPTAGGLYNINWDCLGKSWSAEYGGADVYGMAPFESDCFRDVVLVGDVVARHVDWKYGFESFASYGKDQWEISLLPNTPVLIREIVVRPVVCGLSPSSSPYSVYSQNLPHPAEECRTLSKPIRGSTGPAGEVWMESCKEVRGRPRALTPAEARLEGFDMAEKPPLRLYTIYEVRGPVEYPVAHIEAQTCLDALSKVVSPDIMLLSLNINQEIDACITGFRKRGSSKIITMTSYVARRVLP